MFLKRKKKELEPESEALDEKELGIKRPAIDYGVVKSYGGKTPQDMGQKNNRESPSPGSLKDS